MESSEHNWANAPINVKSAGGVVGGGGGEAHHGVVI